MGNPNEDNRYSETQRNVGTWILVGLGALILVGLLSWTTSERTAEVQPNAQPQVEGPADTGSSSGETGKTVPNPQ